MDNLTTVMDIDTVLAHAGAECDRLDPNPSRTRWATFYLALHLAGLIPHILIFPATIPMARKWTAFFVLLNIVRKIILLKFTKFLKVFNFFF